MRVRDIPVGPLRDVCGAFFSPGGAGERVRIAVVVGPGAPRDVVLALKRALVPETPLGLVHVEAPLVTGSVVVNPDSDAAIVCARDELGAAVYARAFSEAGVPAAICVESGVDAPEESDLAGARGVALVAGSSSEVLLEKLASWLADVCPAPVSLATSFPFARAAVTRALVRRRSAQNAAVAMLPFGPATELPVMTANQALMALDLASCHGRGSTPERLWDVAAALVCGLAGRGVARSVTAALPGLGWLARPVVAYAATSLLGRALLVRLSLEERADVRPPDPNMCPCHVKRTQDSSILVDEPHPVA